MKLTYLLLLVYTTNCDLEMSGEMLFDSRLLNIDLEKYNDHYHHVNRRDMNVTQSDGAHVTYNGTQEVRVSGMTAAPPVECADQFPEEEQVEAMLSHMMNQLTKMFVRAHEVMRGPGGPGRPGGPGGPGEPGGRRALGTRFRVVERKHTDFFELIFNDMITEYRRFYRKRAQEVQRARLDPCRHQHTVRQLWRELLEQAAAVMRRAARRCAEEYLRTADGGVGDELRRLLLSELGKVRAGQLDMLCDNFQLCFDDLL